MMGFVLYKLLICILEFSSENFCTKRKENKANFDQVLKSAIGLRNYFAMTILINNSFIIRVVFSNFCTIKHQICYDIEVIFKTFENIKGMPSFKNGGHFTIVTQILAGKL